MSRSVDRVRQIIHDGIIHGRFAPGQHLVEEDIASSLGVSRTPVRDALQILAGQGMVVFRPHLGAYVERFSADDVNEIYSLRASLESHAAARAAARIDEVGIAELERLTDQLEALKGGETTDGYVTSFHELNADFHKAVLAAAESTRLERLLASVIDIPLIPMKHYTWRALVDLERSCLQHREMIAALAAHDAEWARAVMAGHILGARGNQAVFPLGARDDEARGNEALGDEPAGLEVVEGAAE